MSRSKLFDLSRHRAVCAAAAVVCLTGTAAFAQVSTPALAPQGVVRPSDMPAPPPGPRAKLRPSPAAVAPGVASTASGRIARWLQNPNGDIDGMILEDGTQVVLPPTQSARLVQSVKLRDSVQVTGTRDGEAAGAKVLRASQIRDAAGKTVSFAEGEPGDAPPPAPREPAALTPMNANGRIATLLYTGRGDVNGVLLSDGTAVRFPPHVGAELAPTLKVGAPLFAKGYGTRNGQGSSLEATRLGASEGSARDVFGPPGPLGAPGSNPAGPQGAGVDAPAPPLPR